MEKIDFISVFLGIYQILCRQLFLTATRFQRFLTVFLRPMRSMMYQNILR